MWPVLRSPECRAALVRVLDHHLKHGRLKAAAEEGSFMRFEKFSFGSIQIDGRTYEDDITIDRGFIRKRHKKPSKKFREQFGHTPLSVEEEIPWRCRRLVIGTGMYGRLPVMEELKDVAQRRKIELLLLPTEKAIRELRKGLKDVNAVLHVTC
jgi:hypothetical protein